jgi:hypothetical protein
MYSSTTILNKTTEERLYFYLDFSDILESGETVTSLIQSGAKKRDESLASDITLSGVVVSSDNLGVDLWVLGGTYNYTYKIFAEVNTNMNKIIMAYGFLNVEV